MKIISIQMSTAYASISILTTLGLPCILVYVDEYSLAVSVWPAVTEQRVEDGAGFVGICYNSVYSHCFFTGSDVDAHC